MHEIEVKATLRNKEAVLKKLEELGCALGDAISQDDGVFVEHIGSIEKYLSNKAFSRIRVTGDGDIIYTLKYHLVERSGDPTSTPMEHEVKINSREEMEKILNALGYTEAVRTKKTRRKGKHQAWEICIDEVEGLGSFIEIEELGDAKDAERIHASMLTFLGTLGIAPEDMFTQRYDLLLLEKAIQDG